jgi:hypothetical protein
MVTTGESDEAAADGPPTPSPRPRRRGRWVAAISFAVVIGLLAGFLATQLNPVQAAGTGVALTHPKSTPPTSSPSGGCRLVPMKLAEVTREPDGTTIYDFTGNGTWSDETVPTPGFNPLTATNAQLRANGFPPRPPGNDRIALRAWTTAMEHSKKAVVSVPVMSIGSGCNDHTEPEMRTSSKG